MFLSRAWEPLDQPVVDVCFLRELGSRWIKQYADRVFPSRAWEPLDQPVVDVCFLREVVVALRGEMERE